MTAYGCENCERRGELEEALRNCRAVAGDKFAVQHDRIAALEEALKAENALLTQYYDLAASRYDTIARLESKLNKVRSILDAYDGETTDNPWDCLHELHTAMEQKG